MAPGRRQRSAATLAAATLVMAFALVAAPGGARGAPRIVAATGPVIRVPAAIATDLADVALLPAGGADRAPRLLAVAEDRSVYGRIRLSVLERGGGRWSARDDLVIEPPVLAQAGTPWLVALDERRFAVIAVAPELDETWVRTVTWTGDALRLDEVAGVRALIDDAGAADVDGDGTRELVLAQTATRRGGPTCQGSRVLTLDARTLEMRHDFTVENVRLAAGAVANLDGRPGDELVAHAFGNCPAGPGSAERSMVVAVRLADGRSLFGQGTTPADLVASWSGWPVIADLERDGRPEVLLGSLMQLAIVSPDAGWKVDGVPSLPGVLLGSTDGPTGTVVAVATGDRLTVGALRRGRTGWAVEPVGDRNEAAVGSVAWDAAAVDRRSAWLSARPRLLDVGASGACTGLLVPLAAVRCDPESDGWSVGPAPAWFATRMVAAIRGGADVPEGIVVAHADGWPGVPSRLVAPAPLASAAGPGVWRHGPSGPFSLHEVAGTVGELAGPGAPPSVVPVLTGDPPSLEANAGIGSRLVLSVAPGPTDAATSGREASLHRLLARGSPPDGQLALHRVEDAGSAVAGDDGPGSSAPDVGAVRVPLLPSGSVEERTWTATAIAIDPVGNVSAATGQRVSTDYVPPAVALDIPVFTPPWPFRSTIRGVTEPGASLTAGGRPVDVADDGRFELEAVLAPWPQRLELDVRDAAGNRRTLRPDVVGGFDYRGLPWIAIVVAGVLTWAAFAGIRMLRRPPAPGSLAAATATDGPTLEELEPAPPRRRP